MFLANTQIVLEFFLYTVKPVLTATQKEHKIVFQYQLSLYEGKKYCRMLQGEHSAILSTFIKLPFVVKAFVLYNFKWPLKTGFIVHTKALAVRSMGSLGMISSFLDTDWKDSDQALITLIKVYRWCLLISS